MNRPCTRFAAAALLLLASALPAAAAGMWTAVASTGVVDESAVGIYSFGTTNLGYLPGSPSVASIVARYNVTNTWAVSDTPPWNTFQLGYFDNNPGSVVKADLIQVSRCTGAQVILCSVASVDNAASTCIPCTFGTPVNFGANDYYVQVSISRNSNALTPQALTLRIF